ncbi:MAG TPA: L-ribulose-5-phosphate 3-epimerase [Anaerolineae bacterium]|nr:L-ribulose-5-phosphate 3-epimerase [Anaerolineae bacterium]
MAAALSSRPVAQQLPVGIYEKALPADLEWEERLRLAAEAGFDFVEISIDESDGRLARLDWASSQRAALRRAIANTGVPIMTMCLSGHRKYPLGSASSQIRERALGILRGAIEFAADIGLSIVQVMGYDVFYEPAFSGTEARFLDGLEQGVRWAGASGVMLGLENCDLEFADSIDKSLRIVEHLRSPWLQLYPDMGNLAASGYDPADQLRRAAGHLVAVHVKDTTPGVVRGVPFEQGLVPFGKVFQTLAEIGFWGAMTVEMWSDTDAVEDSFGSVVAARQLVARLVAEAWPGTE